MHTRHTQPDPTPDRPTNRSPARTPPEPIVRTPTDRAPRTFTRSSHRLQNLVDEFNAGFPGSTADRETQS
ncbi:hypothetical protein ACFO5R_14085 [Halosolutus amylolyticus]|uniref:Uncharacterized protein n=1 Tax=Halosolutus amylolyticus TaxID=2932267 RepID=A0ABD5PRU0_9EURY|nr:hypothetical protein [Halosolutus amylolyticus]